MTHRIGFVSTRIAGTDGVSLEIAKWAAALKTMDCECFYFAGECDRPKSHSIVVPEAHFGHPQIQLINVDLFGNYNRTLETSQNVNHLLVTLKNQLYKFIERFKLDILIPENALSIPMNVPLGLALTEILVETDMTAIAHHHDFSWERTRFAINAAEDYLRSSFPPTLRNVRHVVINSFASEQLALRTGAHSITLVPNVMDFENPPEKTDNYADDMRKTLGIESDEYFLLQPTRIVPRKRIEEAIDFTRRLGLKAALVISHSGGDEGLEYTAYLKEYAQILGVRVILAADYFSHQREKQVKGHKVYSLADAYMEADLVTYPSKVEGFGNAFLETIYYKRPIVMSTYEIFKTDILPKGFQVVSYEDFITDDAVKQARNLLKHPKKAAKMAEANYELGRRYYSYRTLEDHLRALLTSSIGG